MKTAVMFGPLDPGDLHRSAPMATTWRAITPVPENGPRSVPSHRLGKPSHHWAYRDAAGRLLFIVYRFDKANGEKELLPLTYCEGPGGKREWRWQAPPEPRPLYGLDRLARRPDAPVLVCEGEKAADAADALFQDYVAVTSQGGASAAGKSDWAPLRGRDVTAWPDHDERGWSYAADVVRLAYEFAATSVRLVEVPNTFPEKWDVADPPPDGCDAHGLRGLLDAARLEERLEKTPAVEITTGASLVPRPVDWLWSGWLAKGKLHILAGSTGTGKTTIAIALAAVLTLGGRWPDGTLAPRGDVLVWSGEDDASDSLLPRLLAHGGDPSRVHFIGNMVEAGERRPFDPSRDIPALVEAARRLHSVRMLVLDPIVLAVSGDSHKNAEVRRGLQPLVDFAAEAGSAVLGITHFTKGTTGREPIERVTGSLAFGALARLVLATAKPAEAKSKRRLVRTKSNIGPDGGGYEYELVQQPLAGFDFGAQRVAWGGPIDGSAWELLNEVEQFKEDSTASAQSTAEEFLRETLDGGAVSVKQLKSAAEANCLVWRTVERAKKSLGIVALKPGMKDGWLWQLPEAEGDGKTRTPPRTSEDSQQNGLAFFGEDGGLRGSGWEEEI
jgi:putative DNA primase/helicase